MSALQNQLPALPELSLQERHDPYCQHSILYLLPEDVHRDRDSGQTCRQFEIRRYVDLERDRSGIPNRVLCLLPLSSATTV